MNSGTTQLALGTAQFGLAYGVAGRRQPVPDSEIRVILDQAYESGIRMIDTASAYGDVEERLRRLIEDREFSVFSKIPAKPPDVEASRAAEWASASLELSLERLGNRLKGAMFHSADDLLAPYGKNIWNACEQIAEVHQLLLGVSCYGPNRLLEVLARNFHIAVAQVPANAFDQRLREVDGKLIINGGPQLHVRSVFLQGLLLMPESKAIEKMPAASCALKRWHRWCRDRNIEPLRAALAIAKSFPGIRYCVVGVDHAWQLEKIAAAWQAVPPISASELAITDLAVIDPRCWKVH